MRRLTACLVVFLLLGVARAEEPATVELVAPTLRLVPVIDGLRSQKGNRDLQRTKETGIYKTAKKAGVDLEDPPHPLVAASYREGRLFYVFYKVAESAIGDRPYILQRIKKTERTWATADQVEPDVRTTWQVEVFKTRAGAIKRPDEHYGSYGLRDNHRREIVKEYEIGFAEVPGICEGTNWPFARNRLFEYLQRYQEDPGIYPQVRFLAATRWSLLVSFGADGSWAVRSPELGIDAPDALPEPRPVAAESEAETEDVVLVAGQAPDGFVFGETRLADLVARYGEPAVRDPYAKGGGNYRFGTGLEFNVNAADRLNTVKTLPGFEGRTGAGIRHGDARRRVIERMGMPKPAMTNARAWVYDGLVLWFVDDRVSRIVVLAKR